MFSYIFAKVLENCRTTECYYNIVHNQRYGERAWHLLYQLAVSLIIHDEGSTENRPSTFTGHVNTETPLLSGISYIR
jgi:hypothetical protein